MEGEVSRSAVQDRDGHDFAEEDHRRVDQTLSGGANESDCDMHTDLIRAKIWFIQHIETFASFRGCTLKLSLSRTIWLHLNFIQGGCLFYSRDLNF